MFFGSNSAIYLQKLTQPLNLNQLTCLVTRWRFLHLILLCLSAIFQPILKLFMNRKLLQFFFLVFSRMSIIILSICRKNTIVKQTKCLFYSIIFLTNATIKAGILLEKLENLPSKNVTKYSDALQANLSQIPCRQKAFLHFS